MTTTTTHTRATIQTLLDRSNDPAQVIRVWAAANYHNYRHHGYIKKVTGWNDYEVLEFLVRIQWSSERRNLDQLRDARDWETPYPPGDPRNVLRVVYHPERGM